MVKHPTHASKKTVGAGQSSQHHLVSELEGPGLDSVLRQNPHFLMLYECNMFSEPQNCSTCISIVAIGNESV